MNRQSFIFYESFYNSIEQLDKSVQADILLALVRYGLRGEIDPNLKPIANALFLSFKPQIDSNNQKYLNGLKGGEHGKKGGRPKNEITPRKPQENPKKTPNDNVNVNVNDNVNEKEQDAPRKFSFFSSLIGLGAKEQLAKDWLKVRKTKKATNTETALTLFLNKVEKSDKDLNQILEICIDKSWAGYDDDWLKEKINGTTPKRTLI